MRDQVFRASSPIGHIVDLAPEDTSYGCTEAFIKTEDYEAFIETEYYKKPFESLPVFESAVFAMTDLYIHLTKKTDTTDVRSSYVILSPDKLKAFFDSEITLVSTGKKYFKVPKWWPDALIRRLGTPQEESIIADEVDEVGYIPHEDAFVEIDTDDVEIDTDDMFHVEGYVVHLDPSDKESNRWTAYVSEDVFMSHSFPTDNRVTVFEHDIKDEDSFPTKVENLGSFIPLDTERVQDFLQGHVVHVQNVNYSAEVPAWWPDRLKGRLGTVVESSEEALKVGYFPETDTFVNFPDTDTFVKMKKPRRDIAAPNLGTRQHTLF